MIKPEALSGWESSGSKSCCRDRCIEARRIFLLVHTEGYELLGLDCAAAIGSIGDEILRILGKI